MAVFISNLIIILLSAWVAFTFFLKDSFWKVERLLDIRVQLTTEKEYGFAVYFSHNFS